MAVTKYTPQNLYGGSPASLLTAVFTPGGASKYVLTEVIAVNTAGDARPFTLSWTKAGNDIYLVYQALMPAKSVMNFNLYLPIAAANPLKASAPSGDVVLTLNGLQLEEA